MVRCYNCTKNGTATQEQIELLDKGHWKEKKK